jgi:hypothetical protein
MSTMQKVLLAGALAIVLLCSGDGLFGYYRLWPRFREGSTTAVANEVAFQVERSMENALVMRQHDPCTVHLAGPDLDFSTYTDTSGESQVDIVNDDATIVNGLVEVSAGGIDIYMVDMHLHGIPAVQDGNFTLTNTDLDRGVTSFLIDGSALETGFERGINAGLRRASLVPVSVETVDGTMHIGCRAGAAISWSAIES